VVTPGLSSSINIYGFDNYNTYGVLLINKDRNSNHSGEVAIKIKDPRGLYCIYLSASDLNATTNITLGGLEFVGNRSRALGDYTEFKYVVDGTGYYQIPLNYSQVAYCVTKDDFSYNPLPIDLSAARNGEGWLMGAGVAAVLLAVLLM
jgi:hypothetical protein